MTTLRYLLLGGLLSACASPAAVVRNDSPSPEPTPEATQGQDSGAQWTLRKGEAPIVLLDKLNRRIRIVALTSKEHPTGAHLVQTLGFNDDIDGLVFFATKVGYPYTGSNDGFAYRISLRGAPKKILVQTTRSGWELWDDIPLKVSLEEFTEADAEAMLTLHREQLASGTLEAVSPSTRKGRIAAAEERMAEDAETVARECGLSLAVDWSTVKDEWFDLFNVAHACSSRLPALAEFCQDHPHRRPDIERLGKVECQFQGQPEEVEGSLSIAKTRMLMVPGTTRINTLEAEVRFELQALFGEDDQLLRRGERYLLVRKQDDRSRLFSGSKDKLDAQILLGTDWDYHRNEMDPWAAGVNARLKRKAGKWQLSCNDRKMPFETISGSEREQIIKSATLVEEPIWKREPFYLGRDSRGTYYYVDKVREEFGGAQHRVFVGRRGQAKLSTLVGLVEDSQGMLFSTKKGNLRLIIGKNATEEGATWIRGSKSQPLTSVPIRYNLELIYQSLGAYFGERFGDVCEE